MATTAGQVYGCQICANVVKVMEEGAGALVCCGKPMVFREEK
jgi:superoxide reductase